MTGCHFVIKFAKRQLQADFGVAKVRQGDKMFLAAVPR
jgi:hypothetical protein